MSWNGPSMGSSSPVAARGTGQVVVVLEHPVLGRFHTLETPPAVIPGDDYGEHERQERREDQVEEGAEGHFPSRWRRKAITFHTRSFPSWGRKEGMPPGRPFATEANSSASVPPNLCVFDASLGPNPPAPFSPWQL